MMPDYFARSVALRHLRSNVRQNLLTIGVVAVSITLVDYLSALIATLQRQLIASVTGQIPHIVKLAEVFAADEIADRMAPEVPYEVESWMGSTSTSSTPSAPSSRA